ncbi:hypothetical protein NEOLEDRAFT_1143972 [Neolentinus lepideus HHB14362 ss-1]|uniref:Uncharacterized protein n=1 Tax=Neolentinus lepideus HHB14362 ss-1 TaxID=1314782 RepID=A0A165M642_9AGAM|nr:hypothetical protein NEOLEDRAFT_1143972 [Neolentinus lepideus HHB14362 ss-1]
MDLDIILATKLLALTLPSLTRLLVLMLPQCMGICMQSEFSYPWLFPALLQHL